MSIKPLSSLDLYSFYGLPPREHRPYPWGGLNNLKCSVCFLLKYRTFQIIGIGLWRLGLATKKARCITSIIRHIMIPPTDTQMLKRLRARNRFEVTRKCYFVHYTSVGITSTLFEGKRMTNRGPYKTKQNKTFAQRYRWTDEEKRVALAELQADPTIDPPRLPASISYETHRQTVVAPATFGRMGAYSTGFASLDRLMLGFNPGDYSILGAGTNQGKTQVALYLAIHQARMGVPTLYISRELSADELTRRIEHVTPEALPTLFMPDTHRLSTDDLGDFITTWTEAHAKDGRAFVFVDHIHAFCRGGDLTERVGELSELLRELAQDLQIPIMALSQLNRQPYKPDEGPLNWHLKESSYLEQDAYTVLLGWRTPEGLHLKLGKTRNLDLGDIERPVITLRASGGRLTDPEANLQVSAL